MINLRLWIVVPAVVVALFIVPGCSAVFGDPRESANEAIDDANTSISEHNRLFEQARGTYNEVKDDIESGNEPSDQKQKITDAKASMQEARGHLQEARSSLSGIQDMEVEDSVKNYTRLLSDAMEKQVEAEAREIEFYEILEDDPGLDDRREEALDLLSQVGDGYAAAEKDYEQARNLANSNPDILSPAQN